MTTAAAHRPAVPRATALALATALLTALALVLAAPSARAHDRLIESDPADGDVLTEAPTAAVLTFSAEPTPTGAVAVLQGPDDAETHLPDPTFDGRDVVWQLPVVDDGTNTLTWSVISSDGHRIEGTIGFELDSGSGTDGEESPTDGEGTGGTDEDGSDETTTGEETEDATADATEEDGASDDVGQEETSPETTATAEPAEDSDDSWLPGGRTATVVGVAALAVALAAGVWFLAQRRKGRAEETGPEA